MSDHSGRSVLPKKILKTDKRKWCFLPRGPTKRLRPPLIRGLLSYGPMLHARSPCWVRNFALYYTFICVASHNNIVHYTYECAALCGRAWGSAALRAVE